MWLLVCAVVCADNVCPPLEDFSSDAASSKFSRSGLFICYPPSIASSSQLGYQSQRLTSNDWWCLETVLWCTPGLGLLLSPVAVLIYLVDSFTAKLFVTRVSTGCFKKVAPLNFYLLSLFAWNFANSMAILSNFCRFILILHQMVLIFPRVPIVFTLSSFEYSRVKWKRRGRSPTAWFTQNGWDSVVDSTADFLNGAQLSPRDTRWRKMTSFPKRCIFIFWVNA